MKMTDISKPRYTSKIAAAVFIILGVYLLIFTDHRNAGLGAIFIGILTGLIVNTGTVEETIATAELESAVEPMHSLLTDLNVMGKGVMIPPKDDLKQTRVFVPAGKELRRLPDLYDEMVVVTGGAGRLGISLVPPGEPLYTEALSRLDTGTSGIEGAREVMGMLTHGMDMAKSFSVRREDDTFKLRITHGRYGDYCARVMDKSNGICEKTACPFCSAYLMALAENISKPIAITKFQKEGKHVKYTLEVLE